MQNKLAALREECKINAATPHYTATESKDRPGVKWWKHGKIVKLLLCTSEGCLFWDLLRYVVTFSLVVCYIGVAKYIRRQMRQTVIYYYYHKHNGYQLLQMNRLDMNEYRLKKYLGYSQWASFGLLNCTFFSWTLIVFWEYKDVFKNKYFLVSFVLLLQPCQYWPTLVGDDFYIKASGRGKGSATWIASHLGNIRKQTVWKSALLSKLALRLSSDS